MDAEAACEALAAQQHGVIGRDQALNAGMSRGAIERRVTAGRWRALHPGVYVPRPVPSTWHQRLLAAVLLGGPRACASHRSAAVLWRLDSAPVRFIEISVPASRRARGVRAHRRTGRDPSIDVIDGIPATCIERTLIDLSAVVRAQRAELALEDALRRGLTSLSRIANAIEALGSRGRPGMAALRSILNRRDVRDEQAESPLESALLDILRAHGVPLPVSQHRVIDGGEIIARLDFAYPSLRLGLEADGYRWHGGRQSWSRDIRRENRLKLLGWTLLRFSWEDIHDRPEMVVSQVRAAHRNLAASPTPTVGT
jgi:very-short-patch-repair endonuclease